MMANEAFVQHVQHNHPGHRQSPGQITHATVRTLVDHFCCPYDVVRFETNDRRSADAGFSKFGRDAVERDRLLLPFDFSQAIDHLRYERYSLSSNGSFGKKLLAGNVSRSIYYFLRPILSVPIRKHLQKVRLSGWEKTVFPQWPVDFTVDTLLQNAVALVLRARGLERIPFIWFWPDGAASCAIMTHDVESAAGLDFCDSLMDVDDSFGIKSSFQIVPKGRYEHSEQLLANFRRRGFELNVHDLNHDGRLFQEKQEFLRRAVEINRYAARFGSRGFRSGAMYRNQGWYDAFDFSYDMSVPNVAHLEPQGGGCCTVMPYFIGDIVELPLTTAQDYSLFHLLGDYSIDLWKQQIELIRNRNGLITLLSHPDYLIEQRARTVYLELLAHVSQLRADGKIWITLPRDVDHWWRSRHQMHVVQDGKTWRIEGPEKHRARLAYATLEGDQIVYSLDGAS